MAFGDNKPVKVPLFECGFKPFKQTENGINIRFVLPALLFLIFEVAVLLLFFFAMSATIVALSALVGIVMFLLVLTVGFIYILRKGALEWE